MEEAPILLVLPWIKTAPLGGFGLPASLVEKKDGVLPLHKRCKLVQPRSSGLATNSGHNKNQGCLSSYPDGMSRDATRRPDDKECAESMPFIGQVAIALGGEDGTVRYSVGFLVKVSVTQSQQLEDRSGVLETMMQKSQGTLTWSRYFWSAVEPDGRRRLCKLLLETKVGL